MMEAPENGKEFVSTGQGTVCTHVNMTHIRQEVELTDVEHLPGTMQKHIADGGKFIW